MRKLLVGYITVMILNGCSGVDPVNMQAVAHGQELYEQYCVTCHQANGKGLALLMPPLYESDYLVKHRSTLPCIIRDGLSGPVEVNGTNYNLQMPGNKKLTVKEITHLVNFLEFRFAKSQILMPEDTVSLYLNNGCR